MSPVNLVNTVLLGDGVTATNITYRQGTTNYTTSTAVSLKKFTTTGNFPFSEGVYITTKDSGSSNVVDSDLSAITSNTVRNGGILEFDFVATGDTLSFNFMFASREYASFTCSSYNDVFGFFLSGPGINGPFSNNGINLAVIPGTTTPVGINSINCGCSGYPSNCLAVNPNYVADAVYFTTQYNSYGGQGYNGGTVSLPATASLICGETYHIKMGICNVSDQSYDSGVYLEGGSFAIEPKIVIDVVKEIETQQVCISDSVEFTLLVSDNFQYDSLLWNFGDSFSTDNTDTSSNPKHKYSQPGNYTVSLIVYSEEGLLCSLTDTLTLDIVVHDYTRETDTVRLCYGQTHTLSNGTVLTSSDTYYDTLPAPSLEYCDTIYTVVFIVPTEKLSIVFSDQQNVSCWQAKDGSVTGNVSGGMGTYAYQWSMLGTISNLNLLTQHATTLGAGTYFLTVTDAHNCAISDSVTILQPDKLVLSLSSDTLICPYDFAYLSGAYSGGTSPVSIDWGGTTTGWNPQVQPTQDTIYQAIITDSHGCRDTAQLAVQLVVLPEVKFSEDTLIDCSPMRMVLHNYSTGIWDNCLWTFTDGVSYSGCDLVIHQMNALGYQGVSLTLNTVEGCSITKKVDSIFYLEANPIADFTADKTIFSSWQDLESVEVNFSNSSVSASSYLWFFGDSSDPTSEYEPSHIYPTDKGRNYLTTLIAYNDIHCSDTSTLVIVVKEPELFFIPNTFTPNTDPYNAIFLPVITAGVDPYQYTFTLYNRWGEVIFNTHDSYQGWDGRLKNGELAPDGVYEWRLIFVSREDAETKTHSGWVNLIR